MSKTPNVHLEAASTLAVVISSHEPLLFLSADQVIIAASATYFWAVEIDPLTLPGSHLSAVGNGEWAMPKLASRLKATAAGSAHIEAYEIDLVRPDRKTRNLVVNACTFDDGDKDRIRVLLAVTDVTDVRVEARIKDDLVRKKAILLQEVQHRVANSLQIMARVLMQSARKVRSEEVRGHLHNAHHRVMSIASVQKLLSISSGGEVEISTYLTQWCDSLGASMIAEPDRLSISFNADDSAVTAGVSISLGLIVTELVINALKHAFPDQATGQIEVGYRATGRNWMHTDADNGIGMPAGSSAPKANFGAGIVEALTKDLGGELELPEANPTTCVTIRRPGSADHHQDIRPAA